MHSPPRIGPRIVRRLPHWLTACLLLLLLVGCAERPSYDTLPPGSKVLAFGDSVTHGTGAEPGEDYPSQLAAFTHWQVVNAGVPGELARDAGKRLPGLLQPRRLHRCLSRVSQPLSYLTEPTLLLGSWR